MSSAKRVAFTAFFLFIISVHQRSFSATITSNGTGGGNWTATTSWAGGIVPVATDNVIILAGDILSVNLSRSVANITTAGSIDFPTATRTLTCTGNFISNGVAKLSAATGSVSKILSVNGNLSVSTGASLEIQGISITVSGLVTNNGNITLTNSAVGNKNFNAGLTMNTSSRLQFDIAETLTVTGVLTMSPSCTLGNGAAIGLLNLTGNVSLLNDGISKMNSITMTISGNLTFNGSAVLDASGANTTINISGNWTNSSSAADPFIEGTSIVLFNGTGSQTISGPSAGETFYIMRIANASGLTPGITVNTHLNVTSEIDITAGTIDLSGKNLTVTNNGSTSVTSSFSNCTVISSIPGSSIDISDGTGDLMIIVFTTVNIGNAAQNIPLTLNTGRSQYNGLTLYGLGNFSKSSITTDNSLGGNRFYSDVTFTQATSSGDWIFGTGAGATGDIFYANLTINANSNTTNNTYQLGRNSTGNAYYGTTTINSYSASSFYFGVAQTTGNNSHTFYGPTVLNVGLTGNIYVGGAGTGNTSVISIQNTFQLNSIASSIGDIYIGARDLNGSVSISASGQLTSGVISGATNIYLSNITQTNSTTSTLLSSAASNSTLYVGYGTSNTATTFTAAFPCVFNGNVSFTMPNIGLRGSTFNGVNNFQSNGTAGASSFGGNIFNGNTTFTLTNNGLWYLANVQGDDFNANVIFTQTGTGVLRPVYTADCTFSGNITTNTSIITFGSNGGRLILDGSSTQSIAGNTSPIWRKARMLNTSGGVTQNVPTITVVLDMDFQQGILNIPSPNLLIFNDNSLATSMSNSSFVDGQVRKIGNDAFTFPIGDAVYYAPVSISAPTTTTHHFTAQYFAVNPNAASYSTSSKVSTLDIVSSCEYWILNRTFGTSNVSVTLSNSSSRSCSATAMSAFRVARWDGTTWQNHGNGGTTGTLAAGTVVSSAAVTSFSPFTLAMVNSVLPVELIEFQAASHDERTVECTWETASEHNSDYFGIERSSDGVTYELLGTIQGAGNATTPLSYSFTDEHPLNGISYYRLAQVDLDGKSRIYDPVTIQLGNSISGIAFPNPFHQHLTIVAPGELKGNVRLMICDLTGKIVHESDWNTSEFSSSTIDLGELVAGTYYCKLIHEDKNIGYHVVKE